MKHQMQNLIASFGKIVGVCISLLNACTPSQSNQVLSTPAPEISSPAPTPSLQSLVAEETTQEYRNEAFGISFQYPADWYGPDVYTWDSGVRIAIGSDVVYPYGTDRVDQVYSQENSYYVTVQFERRDQPLAGAAYLELLNIKNGETIETPRSLATRIRNVTLGTYSGIEYTVTLPDPAQTEIFFVREVVLFDQNGNFLTVTGSPNNVKVPDGENWRDAYQLVDQNYMGNFHAIIDSIALQ